jgi:prophage regulatory protein
MENKVKPAGEVCIDADELQRLTGTPASTWRYWASIGQGPKSFRLGRRRVWRRDECMRWLAEQEARAARG